MTSYEEWQARAAAVRNAVACPKCHAAVGEECVWGTTSSAGANHAPRSTKATKLAAKGN